MNKKNLFTQVERTHLNSNVFDLSHDVKMSCKFGYLYPVMWEDCIPGDKHFISIEAILRAAPLVAPVMHMWNLYFHSFFVPYRLLWTGRNSAGGQTKYEQYMTGGDETVPVEPPVWPYFELVPKNIVDSPLCQHLGLPINLANPTALTPSEKVSAMPFYAYQMIYNEYYRPQTLVNRYRDQAADGNNNTYTSVLELRKRSWEHDYFTSALTSAQKGYPVNIPLGSQRVVLEPAPSNMQLIRFASDHSLYNIATQNIASGGAVPSELSINSGPQVVLDPNSTLVTDDTGEATTIADLRRAFRLQEFLELSMRGGTRYAEFNLEMFGVKSPDGRLQRPEYITGSKSPIVISEVLNTTGTDDAPQGAMAGHGVSIANGRGASYYCTEHGIIMTIMSVVPKTAYQQGIAKKFLKINNRFEHYFKQFEGIGEQEILKKEVMAFQGSVGEETFGYIPRYSEYKFANSRVAGDFMTTLDYWHTGRQFASMPGLNQAFVECTPDTRNFAVEDGTDYLWSQVFVKHKAVRKMSYFGSPHF